MSLKRKIFSFLEFRAFRRESSGFTLIEIVVTLFAFAVIAIGVMALVSNMFTISRKSSDAIADTDQARKVVFGLLAELRNANTASNGAYALEQAGIQQLIFYADTEKKDAYQERVRYFLQNGKLYKGITSYNGTTYDTSKERVFTVQNNVANGGVGGAPLFSYYDGNFVGSSTQASLTQPVNVTQVKYVKVDMQIYNRLGVKNNVVYTVTAGGSIRNLKTNLGN